MSTSTYLDPILETKLSRTFTPDVLRKWIERNPTKYVKAHTISMCPIARCLQDEMGDPTLSIDGMCLYTPGDWPEYREAALPNWASTFAQDFDRAFAGLEVLAEQCLPLIPKKTESGQRPVNVFRHRVGSSNAAA